MLLIHILCILALLALLWILALRPRRQSSALLQELRLWRYAHRGLHDDLRPENSMAAFRAALEHGFAAELDVHLTRDGQLVVHHDESLKRLCGVEKNICDLTAEEVTALRLNGTEERVPTFREVLDLFCGKAPLLIELKTKSNAAALTEAVLRELEGYGGAYALQSFDPRVLRWLRKHRPEQLRGQLSANFTRHHDALNPFAAFLLHNLLCNFLAVPDFVSFRLEDWSDRSFTLCRRLYGVPCFVWVVRSSADAARFAGQDATLIFEDFIPDA